MTRPVPYLQKVQNYLFSLDHRVLLSIAWLGAAIFINPIGEFPLNDDWAYSLNVFHLSEKGVFKLSDFPAMTFVAQLLWGTIFCKVFGFSFTVLRLSVWVLGWLGTMQFYALIKRLSGNKSIALIAALTLCFNPLYFSLSYTFMTDVPFLVTLVLALFFYIRYFKTGQIRHVLIATVFMIIATMIRQLGIWMGIAFVLAYSVNSKINIKQLALFIFLSLLGVAALFAYIQILSPAGKLPANFSSASSLFSAPISDTILTSYKRTGTVFFYSGVFLLPVTLCFLPVLLKEVTNRQKWWGIGIALLLVLPVVLNISTLKCGNLIYNAGLGPKLLKDTYWGDNVRPLLPQQAINIIYAVGFSGALLLALTLILTCFNLFKRGGRNTIKKAKILAAFFLAGYLFFLFTSNFLFDRYFIVLLPFVILFMVPNSFPKKFKITMPAFITFVALTVYSVAGTADYFAWNKARWNALNDLKKEGVGPEKIDGGFEFNGWYGNGIQNPQGVKEGKSWWFVEDDEYIIASGEFCGYKKLKTYLFTNYLPYPARDSVLVLKRSGQKKTIITCGAELLTPDSSGFITSSDIILGGMRTDDEARTGKHALLLTGEKQFGFSVKLQHVVPCEKIHVSVWCKYNNNEAIIVIASPGTTDLYKKSEPPGIVKKDEWQKITIEVVIPHAYPLNEAELYLWNTGKNRIIADDMIITREL